MDQGDEGLNAPNLFQNVIGKISNRTSSWPWSKFRKTIDDNAQHVSNSLCISNTSNGSMILKSLNESYEVLRRYESTELQRFWMSDKKAKQCYDCSRKFTSFWRKHHCRLCGQIFCSSCCRQTISGKLILCSGEIKVCHYCFKIMVTHIKSGHLEHYLQNRWEEKVTGINLANINASSNIPVYVVTSKLGEEQVLPIEIVEIQIDKISAISIQLNLIESICEKMKAVLPQTIRGKYLLKFLTEKMKVQNVYKAITVLNSILAAGYLYPNTTTSETTKFIEEAYYSWDCINCIKSKSLITNCILDYSHAITNAQLVLIGEKDGALKLNCHHKIDVEQLYAKSKGVMMLENLYRKQEEHFTKTLLTNKGLTHSWSDIILPLSAEIANNLPSISSAGSFADIQKHVKIKKVEGGKKSDCFVKGGVIFSKNVSHKCMAKYVKNPRILLLQCAITYERVERKYIELEILLLQEREYLRNVVNRILNLQPKIIVVHKSVAGIAHEMLRRYGIILILNIKHSILEKLSNCFDCDLITSIEWNTNLTQVGTCDIFFAETYFLGDGKNKTLLGFEVYNRSKNYVIVLRGGTPRELSEVKAIVFQLIYARYNWRFELAFLMDSNGDQSSLSEISILNKWNLSNNEKPNYTQLTEKNCNYYEFIKEESYGNVSKMFTLYENINICRVNYTLEKLKRNCFECVSSRQQIDRKYLCNYYRHQSSFFDPNIEYKKGKRIQIEQLLENREKRMESILTFAGKSETEIPIHWISLHQLRGMGGLFKRCQPLLKKTKTNENLSKKTGDVGFLNRCSLSILFCCYHLESTSTRSFCVEPTLIDIELYGKNDIMLGQFLERCFTKDDSCGSCNSTMLNHVRRYVHGASCVQVVVSVEGNEMSSDEITVISSCYMCNKASVSTKISRDTFCLSYGKYLQLWFLGKLNEQLKINIEGKCMKQFHLPMTGELMQDELIQKANQHCLQQCFRSGEYTVKFLYTTIHVWNLNFPQIQLTFDENSKVLLEIFTISVKKLSLTGSKMYSDIHDRILNISFEQNMFEEALVSLWSRDKMIFTRSIQRVFCLLEIGSTYCELFDALTSAKNILSDSLCLWNFICTIPNKDSNIINLKDFLSLQSGTNNFEIPKVYEGNESVFHIHDSEKQPLKYMADFTFEKINIMNMINQLRSSINGNCWMKARLPPIENLMLPQGLIPVEINEQDFGSIIAYFLVSNEYWKIIDEYHSLSWKLKRTKARKTIDIDSGDEKLQDEDKKLKGHPHIELSFQDTVAQYNCKIYHAADFNLMRKNIFRTTHSDIHEATINFALSLSRSYPWDARGGKSGLKFNKTMDDRFILKEMTKGDLTFFENFAASYLNYMNECLVKKQSTLLAKILGVFKVSIKKKDSTQERSLLVMENLFYGLEINEKFDLKGSKRNRLVNPENHDGDVVLLDENLIQMSCSNPLYVSSENKGKLRRIINLDASFLEQNCIMDYSLLVGLSNKKNILILGIIDYIRMFTLDKRLESLVKQTGLLGGQGKLPTVIPPQRYKQRFTEAMERYFLAVPKACMLFDL